MDVAMSVTHALPLLPYKPVSGVALMLKYHSKVMLGEKEIVSNTTIIAMIDRFD
jgi:hypothetical protein